MAEVDCQFTWNEHLCSGRSCFEPFQHTGISPVHAQGLEIPASCRRTCSCSGIYKTRHITTPSEARVESETVQHERGGKLACATISYPRLLLFRQHSRPHASHLRPFSRSRSSTYSNTVSDNDYSGSTIGNADHKSGKSDTQVRQNGFGQYQGSIWEILPVVHDEVPMSQGCFHYRHFLSAAGPTVR